MLDKQKTIHEKWEDGGITILPPTKETEDKEIAVYSVYSYFPDEYADDEVLVAITKNKAKAEALVKAIEACGSKAFLDVDNKPASLKWVQELPD